MIKKDKQKELRKGRIDKIMNIILIVSKQGQKVSYKKVLAEFCLQEGLSKRTVREYLDLLIDSERIIRDGDKLTCHLI